LRLPRALLYVIAALMLAAGSAFVACNGDDDNDDNGNGNGTPTNGAVVADPDLQGAAEAFFESTFTATFVVHDGIGDDARQLTMIWYKDGSDRFRTDSMIEDDQWVIVIETPDRAFTCIDGGPHDEDGPLCFEEEPVEAGSPLSELTGDITNFANQYEVLDRRSREVAGEDTDCFELRSVTFGDEVEMCFTADGALVYLGDPLVGPIFEATEYSASVDDDDFEPPYPVQEFPELE
jgi:hypothetical protein